MAIIRPLCFDNKKDFSMSAGCKAEAVQPRKLAGVQDRITSR